MYFHERTSTKLDGVKNRESVPEMDGTYYELGTT